MVHAPEDPTPLELERWLLEEQSAEERARTEQKLTPVERARLRQEHEALQSELLARLPPAAFVQRISARAAESHTRRPSRAAWALGSLAMAVSALLLLQLTPSSRPTLGPESSERAKGLSLELHVYRQRGAGVERLESGALASPGDVLQLGYTRHGFAHGVLLSIDGRGAVTLHHPRDPSLGSALATSSGEQLLPEAYELDDAPRFERFIFVAADTPLSVAEVAAAARRLAADPTRAEGAALELAAPHRQHSLLLLKREVR